VVHALIVKEAPIEGFWSATVYNKDGYFDINDHSMYSINSKTVWRSKDGSATIQFGECKGVDNCLEIMDGWNYATRIYKPKKSILDGPWKSPKPTPRQYCFA